MVMINGEEKNIGGMTIAEYLESENMKPDRIAVMLGDRSEYGTTSLADGDTLEIVGFVGGG